MLAVVVSRADSASVHVGEHLHDLADWTEHTDATRSDADGGGAVYRLGGDDSGTDTADGAVELREIDALHLETEGIAEVFGTVEEGPDRSPELLVFASRHAGETGALLTAHHTGNFGPAEFGGDDAALARACPGAHRRVLAGLAEHAPEDYDVGMECTHHGPTDVGAPSMFVELGSGETEWEDPAGARAVAQAILDLRGVGADVPAEQRGAVEADHDDPDRRHLLGLGGGHYAPRFERVARETDWAVGHVAADWCLDDMAHPDSDAGRAVLRSAFAESAATRALVDGDQPTVERVVTDLGYRVVSETWVRETTGVPLALVATLEDTLGPVDDGTRFGDQARAMDDDEAVTLDDSGGVTQGSEAVTVASLPTELLAEAQGIDAEVARDAVERVTLAFETDENGTRAAGRAAFVASADRETLVDDLVTVLEREYDVERTDGAVVVRERVFDPERARTLGIPEGPKFGRLSAGQSVEVGGETIDPDVVHVERERRFPVEE
jgi:D-aminoacyl-tRNA deacylase